MKKTVRNHLQYYWWLYIVIALAIVVIWVSVFTIIYRDKNTEKLEITFIGTGLDDKALQSELEGKLPEISDQKLKSVTVTARADASFYEVSMLLQVSAVGDYDLLIITKDVLDKYELPIEAYLTEIPKEFVTAYFEGVQTYTVEEKVFGVKAGTVFESYYDGEAYVFFAQGSVNTGALNGKGNELNDCALKTAIYLTEVTNES